MKPLLLIASLLLGQGSAPIPAPVCAPVGEMPGLEYVRFSAAGDEIEYTRTFSTQVCETQVRTITVKDKDGNPATKTITVVVCKPVYEITKKLAKIGKMQGYDGTGTKLDAADLRRRLNKGGAALIAFNEQNVDANWFSVLKPETLVLVLASDPIAPLAAPPGAIPAPKGSPASAELDPGFVMAQDEKPAAMHMFPNIGGASMDSDGLIHLQTSRQSWVTKTMKVPVKGDGATTYKPVSIRETFVQMHRRELPIELVGALTVGGKKMEKADLKTALAKPRVVLISTDGKGISPDHAELLKEDTLLLVPPASMPSYDPTMAPAPGPVVNPQPAVPQPVVPRPVVPQPPKRAES